MTCGLPGAGKTTLAKRVEDQYCALRFTSDEWLRRIHPEFSEPDLDDIREPVEEIQWELTTKAIHCGISVILDWGFWERNSRDRYRTAGERAGANVVLCLLTPPVEELRRRIAIRNVTGRDHAFEITNLAFHHAQERFQVPTSEELKLYAPNPLVDSDYGC
jgi:predicted kinase